MRNQFRFHTPTPPAARLGPLLRLGLGLGLGLSLGVLPGCVAPGGPPTLLDVQPSGWEQVAVPAAAADGDWFAAGRAAARRARALAPDAGTARNVILFVGDGMGISTITAARILKGQLAGRTGEEEQLSFERLPHVALVKTYNTNQQVPDSAGTMTALMSGVKTKAGVVGLDESAARGDAAAVARSSVETLLEQFEARGLSTGIVSTARITHATPAACYAHVPERDWENDAKLSKAAKSAGVPDIARQLVEFSLGNGLEVALGGGRRNFLPKATADPEHGNRRGKRKDGRDLTQEWTARFRDSAYVWNAEQLRSVDTDAIDHLLGLFEPSHMQFEADRERDPGGEPSLAEMTKTALALLRRNARGYFLMVEAGRIDHGHHAGNAQRALIDTVALDAAVSIAMAETSPQDTLILVTADHSHTFTIGGYPTRGNPILGLVRPNGPDGSPSEDWMPDASGLPFTTLGYANGPGHIAASDQQPAGPKHFPHFPQETKSGGAGRQVLAHEAPLALDYLQEATVPLVAETHGGEDVALFAGGAGGALFHGVKEQSFVYHAILEALGWAD